MGLKKPNETNSVLVPCIRLLEILQGMDRLRFFRSNSGAGMRDERLVRCLPAGTPDVLCVIPHVLPGRSDRQPYSVIGRLVGIECKMPGKHPGAAQVAWAESMATVGVETWVVEDVKQLEAHLRRLGVM